MICRGCGLPADPAAERCPTCRRPLRPFAWLATRSGWAQVTGFLLIGFAAVIGGSGERDALLVAAVCAALGVGLLVLASRLGRRERGAG